MCWKNTTACLRERNIQRQFWAREWQKSALFKKKKQSTSWAESKEADWRWVRDVENLGPSIDSQNGAQVYWCQMLGIKGKPPSLFNRSCISLPIFNYGCSKGTGPMLKTKGTKTSWGCVHDLSWRSQRTKRELTSTEPRLEWFVVWRSLPRCL